MRAAPPEVTVPLGTGRRERALVAALAAAAASAALAWLLSHRGQPLHVVLLLAGAGCGAFLGWHLLRPLQGQLRWDGAGWHHRPPGSAPEQALREVRLQCDAGSWLLLRARGALGAGGGWCGLTQHEAGARNWHGLRLALYHHHASGAADAGLT